MSNDKPYDFIDPEQYERKQAVQRAVEAKEGRQHSEDLSGTSNKTFAVSPATLSENKGGLPLSGEDVDAEEIIEELGETSENADKRGELRTPEGHPTESNTDKVGGENNSIVNKVVAVIKGVFK